MSRRSKCRAFQGVAGRLGPLLAAGVPRGVRLVGLSLRAVQSVSIPVGRRRSGLRGMGGDPVCWKKPRREACAWQQLSPLPASRLPSPWDGESLPRLFGWRASPSFLFPPEASPEDERWRSRFLVLEHTKLSSLGFTHFTGKRPFLASSLEQN